MAKCEKCYVELKCPYCDKETLPVSPPPEKKYELWIDVYQGNGDHDWKALKDGGVDGVCAKIGYGWDNARGASGSIIDSKFRAYMDGAKAAGLKVAGYWWSDPLESWTRQVDTCLQACEGIELEFIAVDMEQGEGWQRVYDRRKQKYIWARGKIGDVAACNKFLLDKLGEALWKPAVLYTRTSFINQYAQAAMEWISNYKLWISSMPYEKVITCNQLEARLKGYTYCSTWEEWRVKYALDPEGAWKPLLPKGTDWHIWQFSMDHVKLPGSQSYLDLNWRKI